MNNKGNNNIPSSKKDDDLLDDAVLKAFKDIKDKYICSIPDTWNIPAIPITAALMNIVLMIILGTLIPAYFAVFTLSPTIDISYPCFVFLK